VEYGKQFSFMTIEFEPRTFGGSHNRRHFTWPFVSMPATWTEWHIWSCCHIYNILLMCLNVMIFKHPSDRVAKRDYIMKTW